jgi:hypothetical protein
MTARRATARGRAGRLHGHASAISQRGRRGVRPR